MVDIQASPLEMLAGIVMLLQWNREKIWGGLPHGNQEFDPTSRSAWRRASCDRKLALLFMVRKTCLTSDFARSYWEISALCLSLKLLGVGP